MTGTRSEAEFRASDGARIYRLRWDANGPPEGVCHIVHGMGEHCERYDPVAIRLASSGLVVYAHDQRAHGQTARLNGLPLGTATPGEAANAFLRMCDDLHEMVVSEKQTHSSLPFYMIGHSMGANISQAFAGRHGALLAGLVLSGAPSRPLSPPQAPERRDQLAPPILPLINKQFRYSKAELESIARGQLAKTEFDWLTRDVDEVQKYVDDPFCGHSHTYGFHFDNVSAAHALSHKTSRQRLPANLPVLVLVGSSDPVTDNLRIIRQMNSEFDDVGRYGPKVIIYGGARHEIFNEINRSEVVSDVVAWLRRLRSVPASSL